MNKKITFIFLCFIITITDVNAQLYSSPYSVFNLGDDISDLHTINQGMGGIGIGGSKDIYIPYYNPALLPNSSLVRIDASIYLERRNSSTSTKTISETKLTTGDINITFPVIATLWNTGIGLQPISNNNYSNVQNFKDHELGGYKFNLDQTNTWDGGLSSLYISNGFNVYKDLNIGLKLSYIFGDIKTTKRNKVYNDNFVLNDTAVLTDINVSDIIYEIGASYTYKINVDRRLSIGLVFQPEKNLSSSKVINTQLFVSSRITAFIDDSFSATNTSTFYPSKFGAGLSYTLHRSWLVGFDFNSRDWKGSSLNTSSEIKYRIANSFRLGFEFIPNYNDIDSYIKRIVYRGGIMYNQSPWLFNNQEVDEINYSIGLSFPLKNFSLLNMAFTVGTRGQATENLVNETFYRLSISINYNDRWFIKRVIN